MDDRGGVEAVLLTAEIRESLAEFPLLRTLTRDNLDDGLSRCRLLSVPGAMRIVQEGDYDDTFYVIVKGRCDVNIEKATKHGTVAGLLRDKESTNKKSRTSQTLGSLKPGDFFGELSCMSPWPRTGTVFTTGTTVVLEVSQAVFDDWMDDSDGFREIMEAAYMQRGVITLLRNIDAFALLPEAALRSLIEGATNETFKKGAAIVQQGDTGDALFVIRGGVVAITVKVKDEEKTVSYMRAGSYFGEMALLDGTERNATVTANTKTEVIRIDRDKFMDLVDSSPQAADRLRKTVAERLNAGEKVLGDESMSEALSFMAGQGILEGADVLVVDLSKCIFCGNCEEACDATHDVSLISLHGPSHKAFLFPTACRNCDDPKCLLKCPVDSISRDVNGEVRIQDHCIGCAGCAINCPYDTISMRPVGEEVAARAKEAAGIKKPVTQQAIKCDLCETIPSGPQCVRSCPTAAISRLGPRQLVRQVLKGGK